MAGQAAPPAGSRSPSCAAVRSVAGHRGWAVSKHRQRRDNASLIVIAPVEHVNGSGPIDARQDTSSNGEQATFFQMRKNAPVELRFSSQTSWLVISQDFNLPDHQQPFLLSQLLSPSLQLPQFQSRQGLPSRFSFSLHVRLGNSGSISLPLLGVAGRTLHKFDLSFDFSWHYFVRGEPNLDGFHVNILYLSNGVFNSVGKL